jgi:hypothetical protein
LGNGTSASAPNNGSLDNFAREKAGDEMPHKNRASVADSAKISRCWRRSSLA